MWRLRRAKAGWPAGLPDSSQAHSVEGHAQHEERKQGEPVGIRPGKERVVFFRQGIEELVHWLEEAGQKRDNNTRDGAAGDVAGREQHTGAFVTLSDELPFAQVGVLQRGALFA